MILRTVKLKIISIIVFTLTLLLISSNAFASTKPILLFFNYVKINFEYEGIPAPFTNENMQVLVPVELIFKKMGFQVTKGSGNKTIFFEKDNQHVQITVGDSNAIVDGKSVPLGSVAISKNNFIFVPIKFIAQNFGYKYESQVTDGNRMISLTNPAEFPEKYKSEPVYNPNNPDLFSPEHLNYLVENCKMLPYGAYNAFYNSARPNDTPDQIENLDTDEKGDKWAAADLQIENHTFYSQKSTAIFLKGWNENLSAVTKDVFKAYFPNDWPKLHEMVSARWLGKGLENFNKNLILDGHTVFMYFASYAPDDKVLVIEIYKTMPAIPATPPYQSDFTSMDRVQYLWDNYGLDHNQYGLGFYSAQSGYWTMADLRLGVDRANGKYVSVSMRDWYARVPDIAKGIFKTYLPNDWNKLYNMVDEGFRNRGDQYLDKYHQLDGHRVYMHYFDQSGTLQITIYR